MDALIDSFRHLLGARHVLDSPDELAPFCNDWRKRYCGQARCVVLPAGAEEAAAIVELCAHAGVAIVPQGGNTGLCGGATPCGGEVVISTRRMQRVRALDAVNNSMTVEAGCTLLAAQHAAAAADRLFPLSLAAEGSATIGGNLATNAGGVQVLRYGTMRDLTLGLEVVLPDGRIWHGLHALRKNNTGYDLRHLFIGAEGTLGLITAATLKLFPRPRQTATAWTAVAHPAAAVALLGFLRERSGDRIDAFEIVDRVALDLVLKHLPNARDPLVHLGQSPAWHVLIELSSPRDDALQTLQDALEAATSAGLIDDATLALSEAQAQALWGLRENISEAERCEGVAVKHDISVPVSQIAEFIEHVEAAVRAAFPGVRSVCFGHIGDGNLHYSLSFADAAQNAEFIRQSDRVSQTVYDVVHRFDGSISAEHGLGQLKREANTRYKSAVELDIMQAIKQALDPSGRMNPGKLL
ncbi:MAG TPA: FAD-binding oxidoreductase [Rhodocyclaceae bacterium]|nr:FAD-binding oxidoreductase [Rhodocyclaceae bacterium]